MRRFVVMLLAISIVARAGTARADRRVDRLAHLAQVWGAVRWIHPYLWREGVDWDAALLAAIPKVDAADTDDEYATAVDSMLSTLHDPLTHVVRGASSSESPAESSSPTPNRPLFESIGDVVIVNASATDSAEHGSKL